MRSEPIPPEPAAASEPMVEREGGAPVYSAVFLLVWALGMHTMAPGSPHGDSGETAAVSALLGIAHPPGYPFPTLLGWMFAHFLPLGTVAWRVSMLSLASVGVTAVVATALLRSGFPGTSRGLLVLAGSISGLALEMWNQGTTPKGTVYTVTVALFSGIVWCIARGPSVRCLVLAGLLSGLALGGHYMIVLPFAPFILAALLWSWRGKPGLAGGLAAAMLAVALGVSTYLFIPLRAPTAHPALRWAAPVNWDRFSWLVFRRQYMSIEKQPRGGVGWLQVRRQAGRLGSAHGPLLPLLAVGGLVLAWRRREWWLMALCAGGFVEAGAAAFYPKLEADSLWVADGYFTPAFWVAGLLAAAGLVGLFRSPRPMVRKAGIPLAAILLAWTAWRGIELNGKTDNYYAHDGQANLLSLVPRDSLLFAEGDAYIAPSLYGFYVNGDRPDVRMVIPIFLHFGWGLQELAEQYPDLVIRHPKPWGHVWQEAKDMMEDNRTRPLLYTLTTSNGWPFTPVAIPSGLTYRLYVRAGDATDQAIERAMERFRLRNTMNANLEREPFGRVVRENFVQAYFMRGIFRHLRKEEDLAIRMFERARRMGSPEAALNMGLIHYGKGDMDSAEKCWRQARDWAPRRPEGHANMALISIQRGDYGGAISGCEKALQLNPNFLKAHEIMANAYYRSGNLPQALASIRRALALAPNDNNLRKLAVSLAGKAGAGK